MTTTDASPGLGTLRMVAADLIHAGTNDRKQFDQGALEALAVSIDRDGLAQPPTVRPLADGSFEIVAGERRCRAMGLLGWAEFPVFVRLMDDGAASATMLVENMVRADLTPVEEAKAFRARMDAGASVGELASLVGVSQRTVRARLDLLELCADAQALISSKAMSLGHAAQLVGLDGDRQNLALRALAASDLSLPAFTAVCDRLRSEQEAEPMFDADAFWSVEEYVVEGQQAAERGKLLSMDEQSQLNTTAAAKAAGITVGSLRVLVKRGTFPAPDGYWFEHPWWTPATIAGWMDSRRPAGRPSKQSRG